MFYVLFNNKQKNQPTDFSKLISINNITPIPLDDYLVKTHIIADLTSFYFR